MKLLRLFSESEISPGIFQFQLREPIRLKPGAQVALQECSLSLQASSIAVGANDGSFEYKTAAPAGFTVATITPGTYDTSQLMFELEKAMNSSMDLAIASNIGFQWAAAFENGKTVIKFDRNDPPVIPTMKLTGGTLVGNTFAKTVAGQYDSYAICAVPFIQSTGRFASRLLGAGELMVGLSTAADIPSADPAEPAIEIAIYADTGTGNYYYKTPGEGVDVDSGVAWAANDTIGYSIDQGEIQLFYLRGTTVTAVGLAVPYTYGTSLFPYIALTGALGTTTTLGGPGTLYYYNTNPFSVPPLNTGVGAKQRTNVLLDFNGYDATAALLGFSNITYTVAGKSDGSFEGPFPLTTNIKSLGVVVLCPSLPQLQCFDVLVGGRRPILAVVNDWSNIDDPQLLQWQPSIPVFLDLENPTDLHLSNFVIQIVDGLGNPIPVQDGVSFVLLFQ